jgi:hypothetical protein
MHIYLCIFYELIAQTPSPSSASVRPKIGKFGRCDAMELILRAGHHHQRTRNKTN